MAFDMRSIEPQAPDRATVRARRNTVREPTSLAEKLIPLHFNAWREKFHEAEVVVTGHNPFLAAIVLKQALSLGFRCLVTSEGHDDSWPYDLAMHPHTIQVVASALGFKPGRYGAVERFFPGFVEEFVAAEAGLVTVMERGLSLKALARQHGGELSLAVEPHFGTVVEVSRDRETVEGSLSLALSSSPRFQPAPKGRDFLFTRRAILTGRSDGFAPSSSDGIAIRYDNRHVHAVGTAATDAITNPQRAQMMVDDILRCSRFEF